MNYAANLQADLQSLQVEGRELVRCNLANQKKNVVHFLSNAGTNSLYSGRVQKYLQPESVFYNWQTDTLDQFEELTEKNLCSWDILITDVTRMKEASAAVARFRIAYPSCAIAVLGTEIEIADYSTDAVVFKYPLDIDDWLLMMHTLLGAGSS